SARVMRAEELDQFVTRLIDDPDMVAAVALDYARTIVTTCSPVALARTKEMVYRHLETDFSEALTEAVAAIEGLLAGDDFREGSTSLKEGRLPHFAPLGVTRIDPFAPPAAGRFDGDQVGIQPVVDE